MKRTRENYEAWKKDPMASDPTITYQEWSRRVDASNRRSEEMKRASEAHEKTMQEFWN